MWGIPDKIDIILAICMCCMKFKVYDQKCKSSNLLKGLRFFYRNSCYNNLIRYCQELKQCNIEGITFQAINIHHHKELLREVFSTKDFIAR